MEIVSHNGPGLFCWRRDEPREHGSLCILKVMEAGAPRLRDSIFVILAPRLKRETFSLFNECGFLNSPPSSLRSRYQQKFVLAKNESDFLVYSIRAKWLGHRCERLHRIFPETLIHSHLWYHRSVRNDWGDETGEEGPREGEQGRPLGLGDGHRPAWRRCCRRIGRRVGRRIGRRRLIGRRVGRRRLIGGRGRRLGHRAAFAVLLPRSRFFGGGVCGQTFAQYNHPSPQLYSQMLLSKVESTERILVCLINFLKKYWLFRDSLDI